jgi:hypothetical protein
VFQFPTISSNITQPLKRSGTTFQRPKSTVWSTLCEGDVALHKASSGHIRYWLVFWFTPLLKNKKRYLWPTDAYLYSQSCEIHRLGPNGFIQIDWFPYMNCNNFEIVACCVYIFVQCKYPYHFL